MVELRSNNIESYDRFPAFKNRGFSKIIKFNMNQADPELSTLRFS